MGLALLKEAVPIKTDSDGVMRLSGSRVTLDSVVAAFNAGATPEEIVFQYPTLQLLDVYSVITHYLKQEKDIDTYLLARRKISSEIRQHNQACFSMSGVRERLLARQEETRKARDA